MSADRGGVTIGLWNLPKCTPYHLNPLLYRAVMRPLWNLDLKALGCEERARGFKGRQ